MDLTIEGKVYIDGRFEECCIGIEQGKITTIKKVLKGDEHLRFSHCLILPAGVDVHVHFRDPGFPYKEDFASGSLAAAFGGVSCVFDMPNTMPQSTSVSALTDKIKRAENKSYVDFGVYAGVTNDNIACIPKLGSSCNGFKIYLGHTTRSLPFDEHSLRNVFVQIESTKKPVLVHAENRSCLEQHRIVEKTLTDHLRSRPTTCEERALRDIFTCAKDRTVKIHICHLSSCEGLELLRKRSRNISCGVTPPHLFLPIEHPPEPEALYKVNPPLRTKFDREALFEGINQGDIDILESDHAPHTLAEKNSPFADAPSGLPGVETVFPLFLHMAHKGRVSYPRLISLFCENPALLLGIPKGKIAVGRDADFIVVDPRRSCTIKTEMLHSKCGWSPFEGWPAIFPVHLFVRGEKLIDDHEIQVKQGFGRFVGA